MSDLWNDQITPESFAGGKDEVCLTKCTRVGVKYPTSRGCSRVILS